METRKNKNVVLEVRNLRVSFGSENVIDGLSFEINRGDVLAIVGPNGAGKSVLFRTLLGLIPYQGEITWDKGVKIGYVPQKLFVEKNFPISVHEFLGFKSKNNTTINTTLESVGILDKKILDQSLGVLSGGQLQRVLIAWALLDSPTVLLFDEPTAGIDVGGEQTIYNLLHALQQRHNLTVLIISHDLNVVYKHADTVLCINKSQICFGEPSLVLDPKSLSALYGGEAKFHQHDHGSHNH